MRDYVRDLNVELDRLQRSMQTAAFAIEQGHVALALETLLMPVIDSATNVVALAAQVPAATPVRAERDLVRTAELDTMQIPTTLTVPDEWTKE